jgi:hypothetical protein
LQLGDGPKALTIEVAAFEHQIGTSSSFDLCISRRSAGSTGRLRAIRHARGPRHILAQFRVPAGAEVLKKSQWVWRMPH